MTKLASDAASVGLSIGECRCLRSLVALMIPASSVYQMPGADDEAIFGAIASTLDRDFDEVRQALWLLDAMAGGSFSDAPQATRHSVTERFQDQHAALAAVLVAVVTRCYYRDDRVMRAIGMEPRAPFPKGFEVEQGDWSLLDPVRARGRIYRDAPP
ncbi:MAG: hypothetical protein ABI343_01245 [Burkholderiaceae bacterium]